MLQAPGKAIYLERSTSSINIHMDARRNTDSALMIQVRGSVQMDQCCAVAVCCLLQYVGRRQYGKYKIGTIIYDMTNLGSRMPSAMCKINVCNGICKNSQYANDREMKYVTWIHGMECALCFLFR